MADEYRIDGWHLDKRVSVGHLITTITVIVSVVVWMLRIEAQIAVIAVRQDIIEDQMNTHYTEIIRRLERLDDRLAEHMGKNDNQQKD